MLDKLFDTKNGLVHILLVGRNTIKKPNRLRAKEKARYKGVRKAKKGTKVARTVLSLCIVWNGANAVSAIHNYLDYSPMTPMAGTVTNFGTDLDRTFGGAKSLSRKGETIIAVIDFFGSDSKLPSSDNIIKTPGLKVNGQDTSTHGVVVVTDEVYGKVQKLSPDIAKRIKIMPINLESDYFFQDIPYSIVYAADRGAKVISLSLGNEYIDDKVIKRMQDAVDYAHQKGAIVVAAAGNDGEGKEFYPAHLNNVVAVSAVSGKDNTGGYYSPNYSNANERIDFTAFEGRYKGTSLTAPQVAVQMAAISEKLSIEGIDMAPDRVIEIASKTADHDKEGERTPQVGWGPANLDRAFKDIENKNIPNVKDTEPPFAVKFKYDARKSLASFNLIDDRSKVDTSKMVAILEGIRVDGIPFKPRTLYYTEKNGEITSTTEKLADGKYKLTVAGARDAAGNEEKIIRNFDIDTKPPEIKLAASIIEKGRSLDYNIQIKDEFGFEHCIVINDKVADYAKSKKDGADSSNKFTNEVFAKKNTIDASKFKEGENIFQVLATDGTSSQIIAFKVEKKNGELISIKEKYKKVTKSNSVEDFIYGNKKISGLEKQRILLRNLFSNIVRITERGLG